MYNSREIVTMVRVFRIFAVLLECGGGLTALIVKLHLMDKRSQQTCLSVVFVYLSIVSVLCICL